MDFLYIVVIILVFIVPPLVFIIIHLDLLTEEEVKSLGNKRLMKTEYCYGVV